MRRAVELAERGRGTTYPNPLVGAVVVRDGEVVGEGWHERRGEPHAEVNALRAAGERARGATMYVSLEPCAHHGSTPPCTDAILEAGVARVVVGVRDPNPNVSGGGVELLREAGVDVEVVEGEPAWHARDLNAGWLSVHERGRPWVIYKAAVTLDGRMTVPGERWVTGEERAAPRARAARLGRRGRGRHGHRPCRRAASRRARSGRAEAAAPARVRPRPAAGRLRARAPQRRRSKTSCARSQQRACRRSCSKAGPRSRRRSSPRISWTSSSSSSRRRWPARARRSRASCPQPLKLKRLRTEQVGDDVLLEAYVHDP